MARIAKHVSSLLRKIAVSPVKIGSCGRYADDIVCHCRTEREVRVKFPGPTQHANRRYQVAVTSESDGHKDPDTRRMAETLIEEGSGWPARCAWLDKHSGEPMLPPQMGAGS